MPLVEVTIMEGRTHDKKRAMLKEVRRDDEPVRPGIDQTHGDQAPSSAVS